MCSLVDGEVVKATEMKVEETVVVVDESMCSDEVWEEIGSLVV